MARAAATAVENNFVRGFITEASGMNFPESACVDSLNVYFNKTGSVSRRLGIDYEDSYTLTEVMSVQEGNVVNEFSWRAVAGDGSLSFAVIQVGSTLHFYEVSSNSSLSSNKKGFTVDLTDFSTSGSPGPEGLPCAFASGNGDLFVFHHYLEPFYVSYDPDTDAITNYQISVEIRDFEGVDDSLDIDERPTTLSQKHKYNLRNQGWVGSVVTESGTSDPITYWDTKRSDFPSNADFWWIYKNTDEELDYHMIGKFALGNTHAPQGHYILDAFYQDRTAVSGLSSLAVVTSSYKRPSAGTFFSSRVFYAGIDSKGYNSKIYFSPVIESSTDYGKCYQKADPTSSEVFDIVPTDGGVIVIPEIGMIVRLWALQNTLLVFASNGIWAISGSSGLSFSATDYVVRKLSDTPTIGSLSFVEVGGLPLWANADGIYAVSADQTTGNLSVQSLTDDSIKTFYLTIPSQNIEYIKGAYNPIEKTVQWCYNSLDVNELHEHFRYNRVLVLNTLTGSFSPWSITQPEDGPRIAGVVVTEGFGSSRTSEAVVDENGDTVVDGSAVTVTVIGFASESLTGSFRYLTIVPNGSGYDLTFSQESDAQYQDWFSFDDGTSFDSYFTGGYQLHGEGQRTFQSNYIVVHSKIESDSSCYIQGRWNYTESDTEGRWSTPQQVYPDRSNRTYVFKKLKIRGTGIVLQYHYSSEELKPFEILGWSTFETAGQVP